MVVTYKETNYFNKSQNAVWHSTQLIDKCTCYVEVRTASTLSVEGKLAMSLPASID